MKNYNFCCKILYVSFLSIVKSSFINGKGKVLDECRHVWEPGGGYHDRFGRISLDKNFYSL